MPRREVTEKPDYRFVPVDETIHTWAVKDKHTGKLVVTELRSSFDARVKAEELNIKWFNDELEDED